MVAEPFVDDPDVDDDEPLNPLPKLGLTSILLAVVELDAVVIINTVLPFCISLTLAVCPLLEIVVLLVIAYVLLEPVR